MPFEKEWPPVFFGKFTDQNIESFFFLWKRMNVQLKGERNEKFPNAKIDSDIRIIW